MRLSLFEKGELPAHWIFNAKEDAAIRKREAEELRREQREAAAKMRKEQQDKKDFEYWLASPHARARELTTCGQSSHESIAGCPINRSGHITEFKGLAFVRFDCLNCPFCVGKDESAGRITSVRCIGHFPKMALDNPEIVKKFGGHKFPAVEFEADPEVDPTIPDDFGGENFYVKPPTGPNYTQNPDDPF